MKICAIICEYNPFHNGHYYQLTEAKRRSGADAVLCIMSGNFVQRGEASIMDKFTRARHAVLAGADIVIELPTPFATSNAEIFAKGAIHFLTAIPTVQYLCFGAENADSEALLDAAKLLNEEPKEISKQIKFLMGNGMSYARARQQAWSGCISESLLSSPNNILGLEYTKALLAKRSSIQILPIQRAGGGYNEQSLNNDFSSATAIRTALNSGNNIQKHVPSFVFEDLNKSKNIQLDTLEKYALLSTPTEQIACTLDCSEGLENALKKAAETNGSLIEKLTSARYTASRIRRIALQSLLKIDERLIRECLQTDLYLRVLAVNKNKIDVLAALSESSFPVLARAYDDKKLQSTAKQCYEKDLFAEKIYGILNEQADIPKKLLVEPTI